MENWFEEYISSTYTIPETIDDKYLKQLLYENSKTEEKTWQFCFRDLSNHVMNVNVEGIIKCSFTEDTIFPKNISKELDLKKVFEVAKKIYFGADEITDGSGINIAVIDQPLCTKNKTFCKNVQYINQDFNADDHMHSNAIISTIYQILPQAKIYFFDDKMIETGINGIIEALEWIYNYNLAKPLYERIHSVSVSSGIEWVGKIRNTSEELSKFKELVLNLQTLGCYVIDSIKFNESRFYIASPKFDESFSKIIGFEPGEYWKEENSMFDILCVIGIKKLLVPGGGRLYAYPAITDKYYYCGAASYSWSIPIIASFFAIVKQKSLNITFDEFVNLAFNTCDVTEEGYSIINLKNILSVL